MLTLIFGAQGSGKSTLARKMVKDFFPKQTIEFSYNSKKSFEEQIVPYFSHFGHLPYYTMFLIDGLHSIDQIGGFVEFYRNLQKKYHVRTDRPQFILQYQTKLKQEEFLNMISKEAKDIFQFYYVQNKCPNCNGERVYKDVDKSIVVCGICFNED